MLSRAVLGLFVTTVFTGLMLIVPASAQAGWTLFDDFSSGSIDAGKWEILGTNSPDVNWSVVNGVLRGVKTVGAVSVEESEGYLLMQFPAGTNGVRMDVKVTPQSGDAYSYFKIQFKPNSMGGAVKEYVRSKFHIFDAGGQFKLTNALHNTEMATDDSYKIYRVSTDISLHDQTADWHTSSVQVNQTELFLQNAKSYVSSPRIYESVDNQVIAIKLAGPWDSTAVVEYDNVYIHTGAIETAGSNKVVVIPLN